MKKPIFIKKVEWIPMFPKIPDDYFVYSFIFMAVIMSLGLIDAYHIIIAFGIACVNLILCLKKRKVYWVQVK